MKIYILVDKICNDYGNESIVLSKDKYGRYFPFFLTRKDAHKYQKSLDKYFQHSIYKIDVFNGSLYKPKRKYVRKVKDVCVDPYINSLIEVTNKSFNEYAKDIIFNDSPFLSLLRSKLNE